MQTYKEFIYENLFNQLHKKLKDYNILLKNETDIIKIEELKTRITVIEGKIMSNINKN